MIKLFRKIRYNLMEKGKTSKYLKYAIGEIVLVMIGILLALQVNNWNTERLNKQTEHDYYCQLVVDFESDKAELLERLKAADQRKQSAKQLLLDLDAQTKTKEELLTSFFFVQRSDAFIPSKATITDLTSSGKLSLIRDKTLRTQLLSFYEYQDIKTNIAQGNHKINVDNIMNWNSITEFGWQEAAGMQINEAIKQTLPNIDWHLDNKHPYYLRFQETLIVAIGLSGRELQLYNLILAEMEPLLKRLNEACQNKSN
ncbi:MAG: DUF6090 family protein [Bacteroidota bacterium]